MKLQAATFCKMLYERNLLTDTFFTRWFHSVGEVPRTLMFDPEVDAEMKVILADFIGWLETDSDEYYDEEGDDNDDMGTADNDDISDDV